MNPLEEMNEASLDCLYQSLVSKINDKNYQGEPAPHEEAKLLTCLHQKQMAKHKKKDQLLFRAHTVAAYNWTFKEMLLGSRRTKKDLLQLSNHMTEAGVKIIKEAEKSRSESARLRHDLKAAKRRVRELEAQVKKLQEVPA